MAFQRNHVSDAERMAIGLHVYLYKSMYGMVTDLARKYVVSRWFIYYCYLQCLLLLDLQKAPRETLKPQYGCCQSLEERVLRVYLDTEASISGLKRCVKNLCGDDEVRHGFLRLYAYQQQLYVAYGQRKRYLETQRDAVQQILMSHVDQADYERFSIYPLKLS